jgi:mannose-6-phosphate isomerase-like protein (cupin superfamily)
MRLHGFVQKKWGNEYIFASNDHYCGKLLVFKKVGAQNSMHYHAHKEESWYIQSGAFLVVTIDTKDATEHSERLNAGDHHNIPALQPHRLICIEPGTVFEVSTPDSVEDNYRVAPGDSQS